MKRNFRQWYATISNEKSPSHFNSLKIKAKKTTYDVGKSDHDLGQAQKGSGAKPLDIYIS